MTDQGIITVATESVAVVPDLTVVRFGTEVVAPTLGAAMTANSERAAALVAAVKSAGVADRQIRTEHVGVNPWHGPPYGREGTAGPTAFAATTNLAVQVAAGQPVNDLLERAAAAAGEAFRLFGVSFAVSDPGAARAEARRAAAQSAVAQARQLAAAAGVELGPLVALEEVSGGGHPLGGGGLRMFAAADSAVSPIEAGSEQVTVTVRARFALD